MSQVRPDIDLAALARTEAPLPPPKRSALRILVPTVAGSVCGVMLAEHLPHKHLHLLVMMAVLVALGLVFSWVKRALLRRAVDDLTRLTGTRPVGYRAPSWNFSPNTLTILREMGFRYESSLMADERPYELNQRGVPTGIVEIPVEWILDDAPLFDPRGERYSPPREVAQVWIDEFDRAYAEGTMFVLTMHPHVIGHRSRLVALELLLDHITQRAGDDVWYATHAEAAEYVRREARLGEPVPRRADEAAVLWRVGHGHRLVAAAQAEPTHRLGDVGDLPVDALLQSDLDLLGSHGINP